MVLDVDVIGKRLNDAGRQKATLILTFSLREKERQQRSKLAETSIYLRQRTGERRAERHRACARDARHRGKSRRGKTNG